MGLNEDFKVGDVVNDDAGNAGEVYKILDDYRMEIEWEDGSITVEKKTQIIWVSH